jgi:hypothetical protein
MENCGLLLQELGKIQVTLPLALGKLQLHLGMLMAQK